VLVVCFAFVVSRKAVEHFELTLSNCALDKLHVYLSLKDLCNGIVVCQEEHSPCESLQVESEHKIHFHCYLQLQNKETIETLRPHVSLCLGGGENYEGSIHLSSLRNKNHWIKYITKEDIYPLYENVDTSLFAFSYKMSNYIRKNKQFDPLHHFIRQNVNYTRIIEAAHQKYWEKQLTIEQIQKRKTQPNLNVSWVAAAYKALCEGKHLFISGSTGLGKSQLIKWHCETKWKYQGVVFLPCTTSGFEFSEMSHNTCCAVADDISSDYFIVHRQSLLRLLDGGLLSINPKCSSIKSFVCESQFIFCSNYEDLLDNDPALLRRITVIKADEVGYVQEASIYPTQGESISQEESVHSSQSFQTSLSSP